MAQDLYPGKKDIETTRKLLLKEQIGLCKVTGIPLESKQDVLDHKHDDTQAVRGVLHRQVNAFLGKAENAYIRLIRWWYPGTLPELLRQCADYLEKTEAEEVRFVHPKWTDRVQVGFNKLKESSKDNVLVQLGQPKGSNAKQRKELFRKAVLSRKFGYEVLKSILEKESSNAV